MYEAMIGVVSHDYFDDLPDADARRGVPAERKDRMLQVIQVKWTKPIEQIGFNV